MTNRFYVEGGERAARVGELFGTIATRYDLLNDIQSVGLHRAWKRRLIRIAQLKPGDRALDVCCGTGDIAFRMAQQGVQVTGLDFSEPMLAVARKKGIRRFPRGNGVKRYPASGNISAPDFAQGDAMRLPFPNDHFNVVTVGYGLRNLSDWHVGLKEMVRVAKPGGRILVLDFGKPHNRLLRFLYFLYLRLMVPCFGLIFCGNASAYAYILESLRNYPAQNGVAQEMKGLGLQKIEVHNLIGGMMSINLGVKT